MASLGSVRGQEEVLLSLDQSPAHRSVKEEWEADIEAFDRHKSDYEDELRRIRWEAYQIVTMFAAFHAVIFSAVSQSTLLTCDLAWSPLSLSFAAYLAAFLALVDKLKSMGDLKGEILDVGKSISALQDCLDKVEQQGSYLDLDTNYPQVESHDIFYPGYRHICSRDGLSVLLFLSVFTVITAYFFHVTLCSQSSCPGCDKH